MIEIEYIQQDVKLDQIKNEIKCKQQMILAKKNAIQDKRKINTFLDDVYKEYNKYYLHAVEEKKKERDTMQSLLKYIKNIKKLNENIDDYTEVLNQDQQALMREIKDVEYELDEIIKHE